jgi:SAM-dependent methyltransferase
MKQKDIFLEGEADAWLDRNRDKLGLYDPVSEEIENAGIKPKSVLEIGCANGWRLARLKEKYGCEVTGVEPSLRGCIEGAELGVPIIHGTASMLPFAPGKFDLIIYGFCLYLTDPSDWLRIAAEADTVLKDGGHIIIQDFLPERPFARPYSHHAGILSYHLNFASFWLVNPLYHCVAATSSKLSEEHLWTIQKGARNSIEVLP